MHIKDLNGKSVCILGFGREGQATVRALERYAINAKITIADSNLESPASAKATAGKRVSNYESQLGPDYLKNMDRFDVIIKSPGIPPSALLPTTYHLLTSATQIFFDTIAETGAMIIGVTGSKGKSTTSSLIYEILKAAGRDVHLVGNIGKPALDYIDLAKEGTIFVMELSSYQLMDLTVSPHIAVITSFFPEHLDYHGSLDAYKEAKKHIARFQTANAIVIFNNESPGAIEIAKESKGKKIPFIADDSPVLLEQTHLLGRHNLSNIAAAWKVAEELGIKMKTAFDAFTSFHGLPHRLQSLGIVEDIEWVDDAISTTPESTMAALEALGDRVATIILGGQDRGNDFTKLGKVIAASKIQTVILFPGSGPRIKKAIEDALSDSATSPPNPLSAAAERGNIRIAKQKKKENSFRTKNSQSHEYAIEMRKNLTEAEALLWENLRDRKVSNAKFRRQHPIGKYIADFFCASANLAVELDGSPHQTPEQQAIDKEKEEYFREAGISTIRFWNNEVIQDLPNVIKKIQEHLSPLHRNGEGPGVRWSKENGEGPGEGSRQLQFFEANSMQEAVELAKQKTSKPVNQQTNQPIVLLSTASPSYNMFKNFEEKGEEFKRCLGLL